MKNLVKLLSICAVFAFAAPVYANYSDGFGEEGFSGMSDHDGADFIRGDREALMKGCDGDESHCSQSVINNLPETNAGMPNRGCGEINFNCMKVDRPLLGDR